MDRIELSILEFGERTRKTFTECLSFNFFKERYTPFSQFRGSFIIRTELFETADTEVWINGVLVHKGVIDTFELKKTAKGTVLNFTSRGYTSALGFNELQSEIKYGVTLSSLMTSYIIPEVTYEQSTKTANYLYIKEHASMWEAVVNLGLKIENTYPYIKYPNMIRLTRHTGEKSLVFDTPDKYISFSERQDYTKLISHLHMRDLNGTYNSYNKTSTFAIGRKIARHKHINYDRQWSALEDAGLGYKMNYTMRGSRSTELLYKGFQGEDINDRFTVSPSGVTPVYKYISEIQIFGNKNGIFTRLTAYTDAYCNP